MRSPFFPAVFAAFLLASCAGLENTDHMIVTPLDGQTITAAQQTVLVQPPQDFDVDSIVFYANDISFGEIFFPDTSGNWKKEWSTLSYTNGQYVRLSISVISKLAPSVEPLTDAITVRVGTAQ